MEPPYVQIGNEQDAETLIKSAGPWTVASLTQSIGWTKKPATVSFAGKTLILLPEDDKVLPAIVVRGDIAENRRLILEFVSALTWSGRGQITVESWTGGSHLIRTSKNKVFGQVVAAKFEINYLPSPADQNAKLALAFFNEGLGLAHVHVAYSFLSFYKIINLICGKEGKKQKAWINANIASPSHRSKERLNELKSKNINVGEYLYESCRCAIAHAGDPGNAVIDPHNQEDQKRLHADLPLIIELAEIAIEKELGVKTSQTIYREHRYELSGFEPLFNPAVLEQLKAGNAPTESGTIDIPYVTLKIKYKDQYSPLTNMRPINAGMEKGKCAIAFISESNRYWAQLLLDFPAYRLSADVGPLKGFHDDGSAEFIEEVMEIDRYFWDYNCNGSLEVWSDQGECLGRCDAFIPVNVMLQPEKYQARRGELAAEAARRRAPQSPDNKATE